MGARPRTLTVKINAPSWREPLDQEQQTLGHIARAETLEHILGSYFGRKGEPEATMATPSEPTPPQQQPGATPASSNSSDVTALARQVGELSAALTGSQAEAQRWQQEAKTTEAELEEWRTMKKHAPVAQFLEHANSCPGCKPEMDKFLNQHVASLPPDRVKELARQHKFWPPPSIELGRKARA
jgi:hypothetical protein